MWAISGGNAAWNPSHSMDTPVCASFDVNVSVLFDAPF
jgi:hypothetical protein